LKLPKRGKGRSVGLILILLLLALISAGATFALHILWIVAVVFFLAWVVSFVLGKGRRLAWR
jgi:hypothetical protein